MRLGIRAHDTKYAPLDEMVANIHNMGFTVCTLRWQSLSRNLSRKSKR